MLKRVVYVYLLGLSAANLCALLACVPAFIDVAYGLGEGSYVIAFYKVSGLLIVITTLWQAHIKWPLANSFAVCSGYIVICMTVNKFIAIFKPMTFRKINILKNARLCIGFSFICSALLEIPDTFRWKVVFKGSCSSPSNTSTSLHFSFNETGVDCGWTWIENEEVDTPSFKAYLAVSQIIKRVLCTPVLAILNTMITYKYLTISQELELPRASLKPSSLPPTPGSTSTER